MTTQRYAPTRAQLLGTGFLALGLFVTASIVFSVRQQSADTLVRHSLEVEVALNDVLSLLQDAEIGQRGYLLTGDVAFLEPYRTAVARLDAELKRVAEIVSDNTRQVEALLAVRDLATRKQAELAETLQAYRSGQGGQAIELVKNGSGKRLMDELRRTMAGMDAEEGRLVTERQDHLRSVGLITALATSVSVILMGVLALGAMRHQNVGRDGQSSEGPCPDRIDK